MLNARCVDSNGESNAKTENACKNRSLRSACTGARGRGYAPVAFCRTAAEPYNIETTFRITLDGFVVSDNVTVSDSNVIDTGFAYSDHNPVYLDFSLQ